MEDKNQIMNPQGAMIEPEHKPVGAFVGSLIIILILILSGLYLWSTRIQPRIQEQKTSLAEQPLMENQDPMVQQLATQSSSDDTISVEADLNATDITDADKELQAL